MDSDTSNRVPNVQTQYVQSRDGIRLATYEWGNPDGMPMVFVHGVSQCHLCFAPQIASSLAGSFRLVAFDLRGHGASEKPLEPERYSRAELWADDLAAVLNAKMITRAIAIGWSLGGRVLREYLTRYGVSAIAGLNFVSSRIVEAPGTLGPAIAGWTNPDELSLGEQLAQRVAFLDACYLAKPARVLYENALCYNMLTPFAVRAAISKWVGDPQEAIAMLRSIPIPALITHGTADNVVLPASAKLIAEAMPHARLSWYEQCGHSPFQEYATRFNRELAQFAGEVRSRSV